MNREEHYKRLAEQHTAKRARKKEKLIADVESGYIPGVVTRKTFSNGKTVVTVKLYGQKGYIPYDTRTLVKLVSDAFERNEKYGFGRVCWINGSHGGLQIKGKHLNRLKKKMPGLTLSGNILKQEL